MNEEKNISAGAAAQHKSGPAPNASLEEFLEQQALEERLRTIRHKIIVLSGKGGVGKSTVAVNVAVALLKAGHQVGLLDVDIHGPSIPTMLGMQNETVRTQDDQIIPVEHAGLKVMSIGFLLRQRDDALIWRGPMKMGVIKQFLKDVIWGDLDYLIIDSPPGTGDEPLSVCQLAAPLDGALVVTTPQDVATADVRKSINFCHKLQLPVLGVIENMSGFACPHCGTVTDIFKRGGGERMARDMGVPFLGRIPIDPRLGAACDDGQPFVHQHTETETARAFARIIAPMMEAAGNPSDKPATTSQDNQEDHILKIAIPMASGKLCMHFGHCEQFALIEADQATMKIKCQTMLTPPPHEPGVLPRWLHEQGANVIIAGGMGQRAQALFAENGIKVVVGAPADAPEILVAAFLGGTLQSGTNVCDH